MLRVFFFTAVGLVLASVVLVLPVGCRKYNYHGFMVRQFNIQENEYDRIYSNS